MKRWLNRLFNGESDIDRLIKEASSFPRYKNHSFTFRGMQFTVTDFLSVSWQLKEFFVDERMKFNSHSSPLIYDCGSNAGVSILYFKSKFPEARIKAFEPDSNVLECLKKNLADNNITGITLSDQAVWINNGYVEFGQEGADGGSVFYEGNKVRIPAIRLKDLLDKEDKIDCLKMDIEGAETDVLVDCGASLSRIKYLFVEYHSWKSQPQRLDDLLKVLTDNHFRYQIHSIGEQLKQPFADVASSSMDVQLDIYAVNLNLNS